MAEEDLATLFSKNSQPVEILMFHKTGNDQSRVSQVGVAQNKASFKDILMGVKNTENKQGAQMK